MLEVKIGEATVTLPDDLEERFRKTVAKALGFKKGNLKLALIEAVEDWINGIHETNHRLRQCKAV